MAHNIFNRNQNENPPAAQVEIHGEEAILNPGEKPEEGKPEARTVKLPKTTWK